MTNPEFRSHHKIAVAQAVNYHDSSLAILNLDTGALEVIEAERVMGIKHHRTHPETMRIILEAEMIRLGINFEQVSNVYLGELNHEPSLKKGMLKFGGREFNPEIFGHHEGHIGTTFPLDLEHTIIFVADGGNELGTTHAWLKDGDCITHLDNLSESFFNGRPYGNFTAMVYQSASMSRAHDTLPGKFMGLAGTGKFDERMWKWIEQNEERLNQLYTDRGEVDKMIDELGIRDHSMTKDPYAVNALRDFAHTANLYWVTRALGIIKKYRGKSNNVAIVGGCALNVDLNTALHDKGWFKGGVYNVPNSHDGGQAVGGLLYHYPHVARIKYPFIGRKFPGFDIYGEGEIEGVPEQVVEAVVNDLIKGEVIAWYDGREENGPRALGHRSLIGLPINNKMKHLISVIIKKREPWRPVAPIVLAEELTRWFETTQMSPYMTTAPKARQETIALCPAIIHEDGTSRVQTLAHQDNPILHTIIRVMADKTGLPPIIMNTSFNEANDTIVSDPLNAIKQAKKMGVQILYINGMRIDLTQDKYEHIV